MTENTCAPADRTKRGWHWLKNRYERPVSAEWRLDCWDIGAIGPGISPSDAHAAGYRYHSPCPTPAEMAEREKAWAKDRADLVLYYENLADERDAAEAERDGLLRALASAFAKRAEILGLDAPERNAGLAEWNAEKSGHELTPLGRAALAAAKEAGE